MDNIHEWPGSRPCKFKGGLQILPNSNKSCKDLLTPSENFTLKSLSPRYSKRHFPEKLSPVQSDWKSSARFVHLDAATFVKEKVSEISFTIKTKHSNFRLLKSPVSLKYKKSVKNLTGSINPLANEEKLEVEKLFEWEKLILETQKPIHQSPEPGFQSRADRCSARLSQIMRNKRFC